MIWHLVKWHCDNFLCVSNYWSSSSTAMFAIEFWLYFKLFGDYFPIMSADFSCTASMVLGDIVLVEDKLSFIYIFLSSMLWQHEIETWNIRRLVVMSGQFMLCLPSLNLANSVKQNGISHIFFAKCINRGSLQDT